MQQTCLTVEKCKVVSSCYLLSAVASREVDAAPPGAARICSASYDRRSGDNADAVVTNINITTAFRYDTIVRSNGPNKHYDKYPLWPTIKSIIGDPVKSLRKYLSGRGEPSGTPGEPMVSGT